MSQIKKILARTKKMVNIGSKPFSRTNEYLKSIGETPIDWKLYDWAEIIRFSKTTQLNIKRRLIDLYADINITPHRFCHAENAWIQTDANTYRNSAHNHRHSLLTFCSATVNPPLTRFNQAKIFLPLKTYEIERCLAKATVASSNLVSRSTEKEQTIKSVLFYAHYSFIVIQKPVYKSINGMFYIYTWPSCKNRKTTKSLSAF